jgi:hypothetical protein
MGSVEDVAELNPSVEIWGCIMGLMATAVLKRLQNSIRPVDRSINNILRPAISPQQYGEKKFPL